MKNPLLPQEQLKNVVNRIEKNRRTRTITIEVKVGAICQSLQPIILILFKIL
jgi:hypothetical protein